MTKQRSGCSAISSTRAKASSIRGVPCSLSATPETWPAPNSPARSRRRPARRRRARPGRRSRARSSSGPRSAGSSEVTLECLRDREERQHCQRASRKECTSPSTGTPRRSGGRAGLRRRRAAPTSPSSGTCAGRDSPGRPRPADAGRSAAGGGAPSPPFMPSQLRSTRAMRGWLENRAVLTPKLCTMSKALRRSVPRPPAR